jgi:hypothetical protein
MRIPAPVVAQMSAALQEFESAWGDSNRALFDASQYRGVEKCPSSSYSN